MRFSYIKVSSVMLIFLALSQYHLKLTNLWNLAEMNPRGINLFVGVSNNVMIMIYSCNFGYETPYSQKYLSTR